MMVYNVRVAQPIKIEHLHKYTSGISLMYDSWANHIKTFASVFKNLIENRTTVDVMIVHVQAKRTSIVEISG